MSRGEITLAKGKTLKTVELTKSCIKCVHFFNPVSPSIKRCNLTGHKANPFDRGCKLYALPVPYKEIELGDLVEYWFAEERLTGLVLDKQESGHLSLGTSDRHSSNIPMAGWKGHIIRIVKKQAIDGKIWKKYGV